MKERAVVFIAIPVLATLVPPASSPQAATVEYFSQAAFDLAFPGAQITDFSSLTPPSGYYTDLPDATVKVGGDRFSANQGLSVLNPLAIGPGGSVGNYGVTFISAQNNPRDFRAEPTVLKIHTPPVTAIGFAYGNYFFPPLKTTVTLDNGDVFSIPNASATLQFIGFSSSTPFRSITFRAFPIYHWWGTEGSLLDLTSVSQAPFPSAVPEPQVWAILLVGLAGLGAMTRRRRRATAPAQP